LFPPLPAIRPPSDDAATHCPTHHLNGPITIDIPDCHGITEGLPHIDWPAHPFLAIVVPRVEMTIGGHSEQLLIAVVIDISERQSHCGVQQHIC
jgi:hypothetical protein